MPDSGQVLGGCIHSFNKYWVQYLVQGQPYILIGSCCLWWNIDSRSSPTNRCPGSTEGTWRAKVKVSWGKKGILGKSPGSAMNSLGSHFPFQSVRFLVCKSPLVQYLTFAFMCAFFPTSPCCEGNDLSSTSFVSAPKSSSGAVCTRWGPPISGMEGAADVFG